MTAAIAEDLAEVATELSDDLKAEGKMRKLGRD